MIENKFRKGGCKESDMARHHAREAVRLLKEKRVEGVDNLQRSDADIVKIATDIALGLQSGKMPDCYKLIEKDLTAYSQELKDRNDESSSPEEFIQRLHDEDDFVAEEIIDLTSSCDEKSTPRSQTKLGRTRTKNKWESKKIVSVGTFMSSLQSTPIEGQRNIRTSGLVTAKSPSFNLELPLITDSFRRSSSFHAIHRKAKQQSARQSKLPSTAIGLRSERVRMGVGEKWRRKKCFDDPQNFGMEILKISSAYWEIPFDPLRECVLTDEKLIKIDTAEAEHEQDISLSTKEVLVHTDYWEIRKIMRFVRIGNPTATVLALCALKDLDIQKPSFSEIIRHLHGIPLFLNILDTDNRRCRVAALKVLLYLSSSQKTSNIILRRNGIQQLVSVLSENDKIIVSLACDVLSSLAKHSNVRVVANKINIIEKLMVVFKVCVRKRNLVQDDKLELFRSVCNTLWSCCMSVRDRDVEIISESLNVFSRLVETQDEELVVPLLGIVEECASVVGYFST